MKNTEYRGASDPGMIMFQIQAPWSQLRPLFRYLNEAFSCKCFPDLLEMKMFPDAKELTESFAAYNVVRKGVLKSLFPLNDPDVSCVVVGDGNTPRTAAVFAMRTAWTVYSIDPRLKKDVAWPVRRLRVFRHKVEDGYWIMPEKHKVLVVAVHSHADLNEAVNHIWGNIKGVIAIPCCIPQQLFRIPTDPENSPELPPDKEYFDRGIWSPCNKVKVWWDLPW